jgi:hypothetical protein
MVHLVCLAEQLSCPTAPAALLVCRAPGEAGRDWWPGIVPGTGGGPSGRAIWRGHHARHHARYGVRSPCSRPLQPPLRATMLAMVVDPPPRIGPGRCPKGRDPARFHSRYRRQAPGPNASTVTWPSHSPTVADRRQPGPRPGSAARMTASFSSRWNEDERTCSAATTRARMAPGQVGIVHDHAGPQVAQPGRRRAATWRKLLTGWASGDVVASAAALRWADVDNVPGDAWPGCRSAGRGPRAVQ